MSKSKTKKEKSSTTNMQGIIQVICSKFGKGALMALGATPKDAPSIPAIPTGSLGLDQSLGIHGVPQGRITEIYGPESSGKTTLTLHCIAEAQKKGLQCAFIDAEHALDIRYAEKLGVRLDELLVSQPDHGEQALEITDTLARTGNVGLIVVDSVAALTPKAELEGDMGDHHVGLQARLMSQAMRKIAGVAHQTGTAVIFINQLRQKIGVVYGTPEVTTGGNALKYYASVRLDIRRIGSVKDGDQVVGNRVRVRVVKNKCAPPFREAEFEISFGKGIVRSAEILDFALAADTIQRNGSWYAYGEQKLGQGRTQAISWIESHPEIEQEVSKHLQASIA